MIGKRILVCEDNQFLRKTLVSLLKIDGYHVLDFDSADQALELDDEILARQDLLLTDIEMPGTTGIELALQLNSRFPAISIIVMSGHQVDENSLRQIGAQFIPKPFTFADLREALCQKQNGAKFWCLT